jgi:outer membrane protein
MNKAYVTCLLAATVLASPAFAATKTTTSTEDQGKWMVRARALEVAPDEWSSVSVGGKVNVDNSVVPEVDLTYFFTPNIAVEAIAAVTKHNVTTTGGVDAGSAWLLPPTVTLQYHYNDISWVKPYVGAGVNYTHFFDTKGGALNDVKYEDTFGPALQAGVDVPLGNSWYFNADVKKIYIATTAKFSPSGARADVHLDPWLVGAGFGYRF